MKKVLFLMMAMCAMVAAEAKPTVKSISSPDGTLKVTVTIDQDIRWSVEADGKTVLNPSQIAMQIGENETWGVAPRLKKAVAGKIDEVIPAPLYKKAQVDDKCSTLTLTFKGDYAIEFRAYDEAAAYRFISTRKGAYTVKNEISEYAFAGEPTVFCSYTRSNANKEFSEQYFNSFETPYVIEPMTKMGQKRLMFLPVLVDMGDRKVCITETDLTSYPGMYLYNSNNDNTLESHYAPVPDKIKQGGHNMLQGLVESRKPYIAEVEGERSFPWRICIVANNDAELLDDDMVFRLSHENVIGDTSWIKPGKVAWEWWNDWGLRGVDFQPGVNNRTYEYYIDFAAANGIEYVILDEGWNVNRKADLMQVIPEIDIKHLCNYAKDRGVGIVLWGGYWAVDRDMENVFKHYSELGVKGFKIDFMDRDDQKMVEFYERAAALGAKYHLMCDFHGAYKPCGLSRKYPNVVNYEGVNGLEQMKWSRFSDFDQVTYDTQIPFIRMVAGPMDYTQGAMLNGTKSSYRVSNSDPMSQGTRCHQLAMYVVFEAPFNMLCDSPSNYEQEPECTQFIASIPTVWDQTKALDGKVGEYAVIARRSGDDWYVGGLNNWNQRQVEIDLSFLPEGQYELVNMVDGYRANVIARDFRIVKQSVDSSKKVKVTMAQGGGFAMKLIKK
ncbi:MAG: glycoside hydrolase family 97 protein [Alistipes sp.]|jgi:alpha-glucosidase|nr:glycoside hydrolase family 97 protein [Alistipes sp.]MBQ2415973.1 glycoside hydrolase family 97 protein [Alistipes sp.]MBQ5786311.1 glycoside hydrolase family 97 protein [Alistipes sp.]MBQ5913615.1 glycoside hydrolase family 97 protein [Alistipes sp.]